MNNSAAGSAEVERNIYTIAQTVPIHPRFLPFPALLSRLIKY